mmetsp:Transcript_30955/g.80894  ORF Transcript_30955/g.80894 Transcript_30955/m.80894 type:complete len:533 (-) Transcript_30955:4337-5935(-)
MASQNGDPRAGTGDERALTATQLVGMEIQQRVSCGAGTSLGAGTAARICGLQSHAHASLNGMEVLILGWHEGHQRWDVRSLSSAGLRMYLCGKNLWVRGVTVSDRRQPIDTTCTTLHSLLLADAPLSWLSLPELSTFERLPLEPVKLAMPRLCCFGAAQAFDSHASYMLPCDNSLEEHEACHQFVVAQQVAGELNAGLTSLAYHRENLARAAAMSPPSASSTDAGMQLSNIGGFHSYHDLFDGPSAQVMADWGRKDEINATERDHKRHTRMLHAIVSIAVDELTRSGTKVPEGAVGQMHSAKAWVNVSRGADFNKLHTHLSERWSAVYYVDAGQHDAPAQGDEKACVEIGDSKTLVTRLVPDGVTDVSGHLIFRTGPQRRSTPCGAEESAEMPHLSPPSPLLTPHVKATAGASRPDSPPPSDGPPLTQQAPKTDQETVDSPHPHSFIAVPPIAGTLWFFPGRVPHAVLGQSSGAKHAQRLASDSQNATLLTDIPPWSGVPEQDGAQASAPARISIAINFLHAMPPSPCTYSR